LTIEKIAPIIFSSEKNRVIQKDFLMNDIDRLKAWMKANGHTAKTLGQEIGWTEAGVYTMLWRGRVTFNFRRVFQRRFTKAVADILFKEDDFTIIDRVSESESGATPEPA
jgi:hypothetical protein